MGFRSRGGSSHGAQRGDAVKTWTGALPYFPTHELACKGTGVVAMDIRFASTLPALRAAWGEPVTPSSVCRTPWHNKNEEGHLTSLHLTENPKWPTHGCMALDWPWRDWPQEKQIRFARLAWSMGWSIGLHNGFCHIDRRGDLGLPSLPQKVFLYGEWGAAFGAVEIQSS